MLRWVYRDVVDFKPPPHPERGFTDLLSCWLILEGGVEASHAGRSTKIGPNEIVLSGNGIATRWEPRTRMVSVRLGRPPYPVFNLFDPSGVIKLGTGSFPGFFNATQDLGAWAERHCPGARVAFQAQTAEPAAWLRLRTLYAHWLEALYEVMASHQRLLAPPVLDPRIIRALEHIRHTPRLSERNLAALAGLSLGHLQRLFREQLGRPIGALADEACLHHAQAMLAAPDARIKDVAAHTGFANAQTFARWFRKHAACTPTEYQTRRLHAV